MRRETVVSAVKLLRKFSVEGGQNLNLLFLDRHEAICVTCLVKKAFRPFFLPKNI